MIPDRMRIDVPAGDARRVEREVLGQLKAMRAIDRAEAVAPRRRARWVSFAVPAMGLAALTIICGLVVRRQGPSSMPSDGPSLVVTPIGGSSRFTVGDAVIDAGEDTSVRVQKTDDGITLVLQRGSVDCDVAPRNGRPPFRVISDDVHVEVVGTRFTVTRVGTGTRVDVARGKVRVSAPAGERFLMPGESWTPGEITAAIAPPPSASGPSAADLPPPITAGDTETAPSTVQSAAPRPSSREAFASAQSLEAKDPQKAAKAYRAIANGRDAWAALALYGLAELHAASDARAALRDLDELARRFPNGANAEDAAWLRVDVLRRLGRTNDAQEAAAAYLGKFPAGTYARPAAQLSAPR